jgi:hypothetical protein
VNQPFYVSCIAIVGVCLTASAIAAGPCDKKPTDFFLYDTEPQARSAGIDYRPTLIAAFRNDKAALVTLLQVTAAGTLDGAGAQTHADVLWNLLQCWGDERFADALRSQSATVRGRVLDQLRYATDESKRARSSYPKTFQRSVDKTSNRTMLPTTGSGG